MQRRASSSLAAMAMLAVLGSCGGGGGSGFPIGGPGPTPTPTGTPTPTPTTSCTNDGRLCWQTASPSAVSTAAAKPKIIFLVMLDDADYNDFGYYSADAVTPNIDTVADKGVVLSRYYSASGICSPTRASLLTGQSPMRFGINRVWPQLPEAVTGDYFAGARGLPDNDPTVAQALGGEGYTSLHVGKWHVGSAEERFLPKGKGFDTFSIQFGDPAARPLRTITENGRGTVQTEWQSKYEAERIISFLDQNLPTGRDLFVNWWPVDPHIVPQPGGGNHYVPPTFDRAAFDAAAGGKALDLSTDRGKLLATMFAFDAQLGRVLEHIRSKGLYDDSLIIVTSDNGGSSGALSPTRFLAGSKSSVSEGGIRVPFAASWPKRFAAGTHTGEPMTTADIFPTLMGLIGGPVPTAIQGRNRASTLLSGSASRSPMFFGLRRFEERRFDDDRQHDTFALIDGCDKIMQIALQLRYYNVCTDPGEQTDLTARNPARFGELRAALRAQRLLVSRYQEIASVPAASALAPNERLNTHADDLSVYATANLSAATAAGPYNIYRRGQGLDLRIEGGSLVATITGVGDTSIRPMFRTVRLSAPLPNDGRDHRIGLVVRGYLRGGAVISLFIDGRRVARLAPPLNAPLDPGPSVLAVRSENVRVDLGSNGLPLKDVLILTNAIEPDEF